MHSQILSSTNKVNNFFPRLTRASSEGRGGGGDQGDGTDAEGRVKNKLLSMWNNVKYGMKFKTNFSKESPVWLLGRSYCYIETPTSDSTELGTDVAAFQSQTEISATDSDGIEGFKRDFLSRIWMTYRREFPILNGSNYSSDCGWGCMLRSGQMLIAQALVQHFLGRDWRWTDCATNSREGELHRRIIKWFGDKQSQNSPFSIHTLVNLGEDSGKRAGDWYGPGFVAHLFKKAFKLAKIGNEELNALTVCVAQDCAVYIDDVMTDLLDKASGQWSSLILLVPVRLGAEKFNSIYAPCLTSLFTLKQCIGIIGGRPKHSLYFIGYQDDKLIHLDPHYCQEMVDVWASDFSPASFHCRSPRKLHLSKIDPSCCIGFYCRTKEEFFELITQIQPLIIPPAQSGMPTSEYPMFVFSSGCGQDAQLTPKKFPPAELEYSMESSGEGDEMMGTEAFELI